MLFLIKKELTANPRYMLIGTVLFILYALICTGYGYWLFVMCLFIFFYTVSITNLVLDERYKIDLLMSTLPIRRKDIVLSKYLMVGVIFVISLILYGLIFAGFRAMGSWKAPALTLTSAALGLFAVSFLNGIMLPVSYKFGAQATRYIAFFLFIVLFALGTILDITDSSGQRKIFMNLTDTQSGMIIFGSALALNIVSYAVTRPIYEHKDFQ